MHQNLGDTVKMVFIGNCKFIAVNAYIKNQKRSQIRNLILYNKEPEKEKQTKPSARKV